MTAAPSVVVAIIDDNESLCRSLGRLLRQAGGFTTVEFHSAEDFLESPDRAHFRCLLVDIQLGGMSGIALHRRLTAEGDTTPVIYITAHDDPATRAEALSTGCVGFFLKTDPGKALIATLRRVTGAA
jgi:FixJ family two-component response regulator